LAPRARSRSKFLSPCTCPGRVRVPPSAMVSRQAKDNVLSFYFILFNVRLVYFSVMACAVFISVGLGLSFQIYLSVYMPNRSNTHEMLGIFGVPVIIFTTALLSAELFEVCWRAMDRTLGKTLVAVISVGLGLFKREQIETVGNVLLVTFEVFSWLPALATMDITKGIAGGIAWVTLLAILATVTKTVIRFSTTKRDELRNLIKNEPKLSPMPLSLHVEGARGCADEEGRTLINGTLGVDDDESDPLYNFDILSPTASGVAILVGFVLLVVLFIITVYKIGSLLIGFFCFFLPAILLMKLAIGSIVPSRGFCFQSIVVMFIFIAMSIVGVSQHNLDTGGAEVPKNAAGVEDLFRDDDAGPLVKYKAITNSMVEYPICRMNWGLPGMEPKVSLSALDLGIFAAEIYKNTEKKIVEGVLGGFAGTDLLSGMELEHLADSQEIGRWAVWKIPAAKTRVIAVRGTTTFQDVLVDADLWAFVRILQAFDKFTSMISMMRKSLVRELTGSMSLRAWLHEPSLWQALEDVAAKAKDDSLKDGWATVVTGHSLGGGLAQIIAAHLHIPALVWSPVGIGYSLARFQMTAEAVYETSVLIQPDTDLVPECDLQLGYTQRIPCHSANPFECHNILRSECEIFAMCGDPRGRGGMNKNCGLVMPEWNTTKLEAFKSNTIANARMPTKGGV